MDDAATAVETAVEKVMKRGAHTGEITGRGRAVTTSRMGDLIAEQTERTLKSPNAAKKKRGKK